MVVVSVMTGGSQFLLAILFVSTINLACNKGLLVAFCVAGGKAFFVGATAYYVLVYPVAVGAGSIVGMLRYRWLAKIMRNAH